MKKPVLLLTLIAASSFVFAQPTRTPRAEPPKISVAEPKLPGEAVQNTLRTLLDAIEADDYANFSRAITDEFKAALTNQVFAQVVASVGPRLEKGYEVIYLGTLKKGGYHATIWKIVYKDKGDETLMTLSFKANADEAEMVKSKVAGFYMH
jgi:hypothetical protein